ncbi:MAG: hypothetical protein QOD63_924 [Actinomycetota bacterium]|jgi:hypothetical protein|nr:hypothetical protein [Actinomycetota bacterium]
MRRLGAIACISLFAGAGLSACSSHDKVEVSFRPAVGAVYRYEVKVHSVTTTTIGSDAPERTVDDAVMEATDTVLASSPEEVRVQVQLRRPGSPDRTFVVRFDRAAQLSGVEAVDGLPPAVLGQAAFPEFLPAAATAPPKQMLSPGEKWKIDVKPTLPGGVTAHLQGTGKLVRLTSAGGQKAASMRSETRLPLVSSSKLGDITVGLEGVEVTEATSTRSLSDGAVHDASATTRGTYQLTLTGPGDNALPVTGTSVVDVRSETHRLSPEKDEAARTASTGTSGG